MLKFQLRLRPQFCCTLLLGLEALLSNWNSYLNQNFYFFACLRSESHVVRKTTSLFLTLAPPSVQRERPPPGPTSQRSWMPAEQRHLITIGAFIQIKAEKGQGFGRLTLVDVAVKHVFPIICEPSISSVVLGRQRIHVAIEACENPSILHQINTHKQSK